LPTLRKKKRGNARGNVKHSQEEVYHLCHGKGEKTGSYAPKDGTAPGKKTRLREKEPALHHKIVCPFGSQGISNWNPNKKESGRPAAKERTRYEQKQRIGSFRCLRWKRDTTRGEEKEEQRKKETESYYVGADVETELGRKNKRMGRPLREWGVKKNGKKACQIPLGKRAEGIANVSLGRT